MDLMELAYRRTAILGSSGFGLLIAICDSLASDLRLAAEAERRNDIQTRCQKLRKAPPPPPPPQLSLFSKIGRTRARVAN